MSHSCTFSFFQEASEQSRCDMKEPLIRSPWWLLGIFLKSRQSWFRSGPQWWENCEIEYFLYIFILIQIILCVHTHTHTICRRDGVEKDGEKEEKYNCSACTTNCNILGKEPFRENNEENDSLFSHCKKWEKFKSFEIFFCKFISFIFSQFFIFLFPIFILSYLCKGYSLF